MVCREDEFGPAISPGDMRSATLPMPSHAMVDGFVARYRRVRAVPLLHRFSAIAWIKLAKGRNSDRQGFFATRKITIDTRLDDLSCGATFTRDHRRTGCKSVNDVHPICIVDAARKQQPAGIHDQLTPAVVADLSDVAYLVVVQERRNLRAEPALLITPCRAGQDQRHARRASCGNDFVRTVERFESPAPEQVVLLIGLKRPAS